MYYKVYRNISGSLTVNITTVTNITLTGVLAGYTSIITVVPVNILGDGYPNKTIGYLNIIIKFVMFTSHTVIINNEELIIISLATFEHFSKSEFENVLHVFYL